MAVKSILNQSRQGTGIVVEDYANGQKITLTGSAQTSNAFPALTVRVNNRSTSTIWVRGDGVAAVIGSPNCLAIDPGGVEAPSIDHVGQTLSIIGTNGTGDVYLMPAKAG